MSLPTWSIFNESYFKAVDQIMFALNVFVSSEDFQVDLLVESNESPL